MGQFGGFFKGEKKKKKQQGQDMRQRGTAPVFTAPKVIEKGKKES